MNVRILTHVIPRPRNVPILLEITLAHVNQDTTGMYREFAKVKHIVALCMITTLKVVGHVQH